MNWATPTPTGSALSTPTASPASLICCYWFEKARAQIAAGSANAPDYPPPRESAANREVLKRIKESGGIFGGDDRSWILDGANVHVSMVGFDDGEAEDANAWTANGPPQSTPT